MKNNYKKVKTQYDVLLMKINSLKKELILYKNNNSLNRINNFQIENNLDL